ncbi:MAG: hypothetical protein J6S41_01970, partial [Clostridia bacterium]|nr:hypothetical protein [Clostridia bacterium]
DTLTVTATGAFTDANTGTDKMVNLSGDAAGNYKLTGNDATTLADITAKEITISGITAENKVYDGETSADLNVSNISFIGKVDGDSLSYNATGAFADKNAADGKTVALTISLTGDDAANYILAAATQTETTANITAKEITLADLTAKDKIYDGTTAAEITGIGLAEGAILSGDTVTVDAANAAAAFESANAADSVKVTANGFVLAGADAGNYKLVSDAIETTAKISKLNITVTAESDTVTYDGQAHTLNGITADKALVSGHTFNTTESASGTNVGNYTFDITDKVVIRDANGNDVSANYAITTVNGMLTINQKVLSVNDIVADITAQVYDGDTTLDNATLKIGDVAVSWTSAAFNSANVGDVATATFSGLTIDPNYALDGTTVTVDAAGKITAKEITISGITAENKVYDGETTVALNTNSAVFNGIVDGDTLTVTATGAFADANAGTGKTVNLSGLTLGGESAGNYSLATTGNQSTATADITAVNVMLDWEAETSYTYTGADQSGTVKAYYTDINGAKVYVSVNFGDGVTFKNAGDYTASAEGSAADSNYAYAASTKSLTID